ncbi:MAG: nitroreductase family protein [Bacilli bacterium]|nr:nitroreductase family protein [Acholeplasmataceae bacterium]MDY2902942.1 nitroreductase family protein [Bacilli bacterium]
MNVKEAILKRRSIRKYQNIEVSDEQIEELLQSAMAAPSACNKTPWEFYVIKNKEIQKEIKLSCKNYNFNSPLLIVVGANLDLTISKENNDFWIQDCSAAIENILIEAVESGLGTCWCGIYPRIDRVETIRKILHLTDNIVPLGLLHVGYPDEEKEPRTQYETKKVHYIE